MFLRHGTDESLQRVDRTGSARLQVVGDRHPVGVEAEALRRHARRLYQANLHLFEDEADALVALGGEEGRSPRGAWARP